MTGTILVTGGSGYIAGYLIRQLAAEGWKINATIRSLKREAEVRAALGIARILDPLLRSRPDGRFRLGPRQSRAAAMSRTSPRPFR